MRSNLRLLACYLLAMMLVNFHGNLVLRSHNISREKDPRNNMQILYFFRNLFISAFKILGAIVLFVVGFFMMVINFIFLPFCVLWLLTNEECEFWTYCKGGALMMGLAFVEIYDIKRIMWDERANADPKWFFLSKYARRMSLAHNQNDNEAPEELKNFNMNEFSETDPDSVRNAIFKEEFELLRPVHALEKEVIEIALNLRLADTPQAVVKIPDLQKGAVFEEAKVKAGKALEQKIKFYKRRLKRIIVPAVKSFVQKIEAEIDPKQFTGDKKKKYEELDAKTKVSDPKVKAKAKEDILKLVGDYNPKNEKFKETAGKVLGDELKRFGFEERDGKNAYAMALIKISMAKLMEGRMPDVKNTLQSESLKKVGIKSDQIDSAEIEKNVKELTKGDLPDDTKKAVEIMDTGDEDPNAKKEEEQNKVQRS